MQKLEKASSVEREALGLIAQQEQEAIDHQQRVFDDLEFQQLEVRRRP